MNAVTEDDSKTMLKFRKTESETIEQFSLQRGTMSRYGRVKVFRLSTLVCTLVFAMLGQSSVGQEVSSSERGKGNRSTPLIAGEHVRTLAIGELQRSAIVHVPRSYDPTRPTPLVLALHGVAMSGRVMVDFTSLNETSEEKGFIVVYPDGTGPEPLLTWNAGGFAEGLGSQADDVGFVKDLLDDIESVANIDPKRIFACGMSNGAMMCYRLAAELSGRIAAIAPVAGTMAKIDIHLTRPVSVIHFHGTLDKLVPYEMENGKTPFWLKVKSVNESIEAWRKLDGCDSGSPTVEVLSKTGDELEVFRTVYGPGTDGAEVVLVKIVGGGHTWPGRLPPFAFLGKSVLTVSANDLIWAFFEKHGMK